MKIRGREIGLHKRPYLIAEMSGNHNQSLARALEIVDAAARSGVDAIKLQTYTADTMTIDVDAPGFTIEDSRSLWAGRRLYELYQEAHTPWNGTVRLCSERQRIVCIVSARRLTIRRWTSWSPSTCQHTRSLHSKTRIYR